MLSILPNRTASSASAQTETCVSGIRQISVEFLRYAPPLLLRSIMSGVTLLCLAILETRSQPGACLSGSARIPSGCRDKGLRHPHGHSDETRLY